MADNEFAGSALYAQWIYSGGTIAVHTESRNFTYNVNLETIDATAGADTTRRTLASFKSATAALSLTAQSDGTALITALTEGTRGTLIFGEAGTATGRPKTTVPMMSLGITSRKVPYADVVTYDVSWQSVGDPVYASW